VVYLSGGMSCLLQSECGQMLAEKLSKSYMHAEIQYLILIMILTPAYQHWKASIKGALPFPMQSGGGSRKDKERITVTIKIF